MVCGVERPGFNASILLHRPAVNFVLTITKHPFHLVSISPYPFMGAISGLCFLFGFVVALHLDCYLLLVDGLCMLLFLSAFWWRDVVIEAVYLGLHTLRVQSGLSLGISLFIVSEAFFFLSWFWAFLHSSLSPTVEIGCLWPPAGLRPVVASSLPLLNTIILLTSGITLTWSHSCLRNGLFSTSFFSLAYTILLGLLFTVLQCSEFYLCSFTIADSVFGSRFFMATGFHGIHVIIGTLFLIVCLLRLSCAHFTPTRHLGFLFAIWYWHFVDVIWLLLFLIIYVWGS